MFSQSRASSYAPAILRLGIGLVFLWFGFSQIKDPSIWISYLPSFLESSPISPNNFILFNGIFEVILASLLLFGFLVRTSALLLSLHLFAITFSIGLSPVGVRDFGLAVATLAIFFQGKDIFCLGKNEADI